MEAFCEIDVYTVAALNSTDFYLLYGGADLRLTQDIQRLVGLEQIAQTHIISEVDAIEQLVAGLSNRFLYLLLREGGFRGWGDRRELLHLSPVFLIVIELFTVVGAIAGVQLLNLLGCQHLLFVELFALVSWVFLVVVHSVVHVAALVV